MATQRERDELDLICIIAGNIFSNSETMRMSDAVDFAMDIRSIAIDKLNITGLAEGDSDGN